MPTVREITKRAYQCGLYEAQDVLAETGDVDLIRLQPTPRLHYQWALHKRLTHHDISRQLVFRNPGAKEVELTREYDLFVAVCQSISDVLYFNAIKGWRDNCQTAVCWLDEMWEADLSSCKYWLPALEKFDHVFVGSRGTVAPLSKAVGRACHWLPGAVDTLRFTPYPTPPARLIDVYSIGRRRERIHRALLEGLEKRGMLYVYDSCPEIAEMRTYDPAQHRSLFANMAKRSRYFMVAPGKVDVLNQTQQTEVGYRYFEGLAAGAVLIGQEADCEAFRELFPWSGVVMPLEADGSDAMDVLAFLDANPERCFEMSRKNATEALLRHDWIHRWKKILECARLESLPSQMERERQLQELANLSSNAFMETGTSWRKQACR